MVDGHEKEGNNQLMVSAEKKPHTLREIDINEGRWMHADDGDHYVHRPPKVTLDVQVTFNSDDSQPTSIIPFTLVLNVTVLNQSREVTPLSDRRPR